ncbi:MAG: hypothetical protein WCZ27_07135 [Tissierellaceae bacterium]
MKLISWKAWLKPMGNIAVRFVRLFLGYFIYAIGIVMTINASLGLAPWDVLHQGLTNILPITMGQGSIAIGFMVILVNVILKENIGWATVFNMIFIGIFMDLLMLNNLVPVFSNLFLRFVTMLLGILVSGYGGFIYIGTGFGIGPRDGLMVALTRKTGKSIRLVKNTTEIIVIVIGFFLGGSVGIGTAIMSLAGGYLFQFAFKTVGFNVTEVKHRYIMDDIKFIKERIMKTKEGEA